jgi:hypothetical protein
VEVGYVVNVSKENAASIIRVKVNGVKIQSWCTCEVT